MSDAAHKKFSQEIMALKDTLGYSAAEFAGMLMGAAVVMAQEARLTKGQVITVAARTYDQQKRREIANDV